MVFDFLPKNSNTMYSFVRMGAVSAPDLLA
jgi:hypothetical protein